MKITQNQWLNFDIKVEESIAVCNKWVYTNGAFPCDDTPLNGGKEPPCWELAENPWK